MWCQEVVKEQTLVDMKACSFIAGDELFKECISSYVRLDEKVESS